MLDSLRKNSQSFLVKSVLAAIVIVFIFWGVGTFSARRLQVVARVNGEVISDREFESAYQNVQRSYAQSLPADLSEGILRERTLDHIITARLVTQEAARLGLMVTEEELRDSIAARPEFQANGRFDRDLYLRVLRANGLTPPAFEASHRQDLLVQKMYDLITAGAHVTEAQALARFRYENERVGLKVIKVSSADFRSRVAITEEDARRYFEENRERFREPERVSIRYLPFQTEKFAEGAEPSEDDVRAYYEENADRFRATGEGGVQTTRPLEEVRDEIVKSLKLRMGRDLALKRAEDAHDRLLDGEDMNAVASSFGMTVTETPPFSRQETVVGLSPSNEVREAAFAVEKGEVGEILTLGSGYVVFMVSERKASYLPEFETVRAQVEEELRGERAREAARKHAEELLAKVKEAPDRLAAIAAENGLAVEDIAPFSRRDGSLSGISDVPELREAAFQLGPDQPVAPRVYQGGANYFIAVFQERLPAEENAFAEQKDALLEQERKRLELTLVEEFLNYLKGKAKIEYGEAYAARAR